MKSIWVNSMCKKSFWVVQEGFLGEESLGEKYMSEKYVQEGSLGEKYMAEMSVQEEFLCSG